MDQELFPNHVRDVQDRGWSDPMTECHLLEGCQFCNGRHDVSPSFVELLMELYCKRHFNNCARYKIATTLGGPKVPPDLFPNNIERANKILAHG